MTLTHHFKLEKFRLFWDDRVELHTALRKRDEIRSYLIFQLDVSISDGENTASAALDRHEDCHAHSSQITVCEIGPSVQQHASSEWDNNCLRRYPDDFSYRIELSSFIIINFNNSNNDDREKRDGKPSWTK